MFEGRIDRRRIVMLGTVVLFCAVADAVLIAAGVLLGVFGSLGLVVLFAWLFHGPWLKFKRAVDAKDFDAACKAITDPARLADDLKLITGVVEHGLFLDLADEALIGTDDGVVKLVP